MVFQPKHTDFTLSPYTGLTRESWIEAGVYMLAGIFQHMKSFDDPVVVPRQETKITYPHLNASEASQCAERKAEMFEGLTRSFFIAAPLISINPELTVCGYKMKDYYKNQILRSCTSGDAHCVGTYEELQEITGHSDPFRAFQQTVETCALVIGLWASREAIWADYTKEEKNIIAAFLTSFAHANTVPQNWRMFNMLDMAFLHKEGYPIDKEIMLDHAQAVLDYYVGDGWYRDGQSFDYYSCWAFNFYAPLWNQWYGYENEPFLAEKFEQYSNCLMESFADFFDEDGFTNMWGRSCIYRFASTSAFDGNMMLRHSTADAGLARRIASGSLLQFLSREDFRWEGIPTMGFYGQFSPLVQGYSCAESPFWMGKAFLCLHLPENHPFWTEKENNGTWEKLGDNNVKQTALNGPALCFTNHKANGETILRTGKIVKNVGDKHGLWNYAKLCFNTKYPWEATPQQIALTPQQDAPISQQTVSTSQQESESQIVFEKQQLSQNEHGLQSELEKENAYAEFEHEQKKGAENSSQVLEPLVVAGEVESQQYVLKDLTYNTASLANATFWGGVRDNVLYRRQYFDYRLNTETHWIQGLFLADFPVPCGIVRVDKMKLFRRPVSFTLGSYGFPDNGTTITEYCDKNAKAMVLCGKDATGKPRQLAMTIYDGWDALKIIHSSGTNPDSKHSIIVYAETKREKQYGGCEPYIMISQVITKESEIPFSHDEVFPIRSITYTDKAECGTYGPVTIALKNGETRVIDYEMAEGTLSL